MCCTPLLESGGEYDFRDEPHILPVIEALSHVMNILPKGIANGTPHNHHWEGHPYEDLDQIWMENIVPTGVVRAFASTYEGKTYVAVMGMKTSYTIKAKYPMVIEVYNVLTGRVEERVDLGEDDLHTFLPRNGRDFIHVVERT